MRVHFLTYADSKFYKQQDSLMIKWGSSFDACYCNRDSYFKQTQFYQDNISIASASRGAGYCIWKPYYILEVLNKMNHFDCLFYMDSGDMIVKDGLPDFIRKQMDSEDYIFTAGVHPQKQYCKQDTFQGMDCDNEEFKNAIQVEAGIMVLKKTMTPIVEEWLKWCCCKPCIVDECIMPNDPEFIDNRYDQSILTNIITKNKLKTSSALREYVVCNFPST